MNDEIQTALSIVDIARQVTKNEQPLQSIPQLNLSSLFTEKNNFYLNGFGLFLSHFHAIPNFIQEINIDCNKAHDWFLEMYGDVVKDMHYSRLYSNRKQINMPVLDDVFYVLHDDLVVWFDFNKSAVNFYFRKTDANKVEVVMMGAKLFKKRKLKHQSAIVLLVNSRYGIIAKAIDCAKPKLNIEDNYNSDFAIIHQTIFKRLSKKNDKGLVLLHGKPGTGKTSYIRYLISKVKKAVIFLPPNMASAITNPELISILIDNPNSIFVIEDAENIIIDRERNGGSPVSALLNISDGLLSDCLNIQIICSFNTDISKVDSALMRKGRLIAKYEFKELETEKAKSLSQKLGFKTEVNSPMTLASIYNQEEKDFVQAKKNSVIGF